MFVNDAYGVRDRHVAFLASFHSPEVIFEQISIIYSLPKMFVASFTLILPFFPTGTSERVEREGARALRSGPSGSAVSQRAPPVATAVTARSTRGFFEDDDDDYGDDAPAGREPDYVDEIFLNRLGLDAAQVLAIQLKIGKGKGGG